MQTKNIAFIVIIIISIFIFSYNFFKDDQEKIETKKNETDEIVNNSSIIENVIYSSKDVDGNEYTINAVKGEIDYSNSNIIYLNNVTATISLKNYNIIIIKSDFGKYNSSNFDTIFSKNVMINYLDNKITGEYLDFSPNRNSMILSRQVVYTNSSNILKADVVEINLKTKDTKIFMYEKNKKVNIESKY